MSDLSGFVWSIADLLRGPYKPKQYGNVILPFTVLRRLECVIEPHRNVMSEVLRKARNDTARRSLLRQATRSEADPGLTFWNTSSYTLAKALQDPENLAANLIDYINGFSSDVDMFKHFGEDGFEPTIRKLDENGLLALVTREFAELDLSPARVDNAGMGDLFEHLIFKFAEASNEEAGDFYTPRDAVQLLVDLVFSEDTDGLRGHAVRSVYDPAAGTGGMLSVAEQHVKLMNPDAELRLYAQEINGDSYAICKADMLIKGQDIASIAKGDTLSSDQHEDRNFDYVLSNPPFGQDWKKSEVAVRKENAGQSFQPGVLEQPFVGRFGPGLPSVSDGAMLFLLHAISKMRAVDEFGRGGRVGIVLNGSPLTNGAAGSGPSNIRGWLLENDLVETIVGLPNDMFYNTGIATYLWILTNTKTDERRGRVRLVDATGFGTKMRKKLGDKAVQISERHRDLIVKAAAGGENEVPFKDFDVLDFAYWSVTVARPFQWRFQVSEERVQAIEAAANTEAKTGKVPKPSLGDIKGLPKALREFGDTVYLHRETFLAALDSHLQDAGVTLSTSQRKSLWQSLGEHDPKAEVVSNKKGVPEPDTSLRDAEMVPFGWGGHAKHHDARDETIAAYFEAEVVPHVPDAWIDKSKTRVGYEIPFTRHFYRYSPPRALTSIDADLEKSVARILEMLREVEG
ncbi:class I SAM-dependent DNA methyltransferase [Microbacterium sp. Marseille-Q6648]|uniref:type I restriction-modification system subunit M n=1 Tax=Microbacterium sp. Marseille-Q6648 TaxID=2937991 RepID=UPI00204220DC|nr:class I SAM-dependent DNA methyltransferase [Microbacterium sp. Marseille-Q6648]